MLFYSAALTALLVATAPLWSWRMLRQGRYRQGLGERLGRVRSSVAAAAAGREVVWVHAVSVGETMAALPLITALERARPNAWVVLSTTTPTGQALAREWLGADRVFFYPLDFVFAVRPWLKALRPALLVLMESELWPHMLVECGRVATPVAVVNARVSDRSLPRYLALRPLWKPLLARLSLLLAQSPQDRDRWLRIGAPAGRTRAAGNLKYDLPPAAETPLVNLLRRHLPTDLPVLVAGSTHPGEEGLLLACRTPRHLLLLAPRHPQRAAEVAATIAAMRLMPVRLSDWRMQPRLLTEADVLLVDTVGDLAGLYALATVAFVGGSLVPNGGHNPLEAARFGVPVLSGPSTENFREIVSGMQAIGALHTTSTTELCADLGTALRVRPSQAHLQATQEFFQGHAGATQRTVQALLSLLPPPGGAG